MGKRKTQEEFLKDIKRRGNPNVIILGKYQSWDKPVECTCKKHSDFTWEATPLNLIHGTGCPKCAREKGKELRKTNEEFLQQMKETGNPNVIVLEEYKGNRTKLRCQCKSNPNHIWYATPANLQKGRGCPFCRNEKNGKMFSISEEEFLRRFNATGHPDELEIIGKYEKLDKKIQVRCKKDREHIFEMAPHFLIQGHHCPYCTGHKVQKTNCLNTLRPDLIQFLKNKEDGEKVKLNSTIELELVCPDCGKERKMPTKDLVHQGFSCQFCGDGVSFPNKFIRNMLSMLGVEFVPEWGPKWAERKRYDVMFMYEGQPIIIEMDGAFHTKESQFKTLERTQESDKKKEELAKENGCKLIRIDCVISDAKTIFKNILDSELSVLLNLQDFDYIECGRRSSTSLIAEVCHYYNKHPEATVKELSNIFGIATNTVLRYLRKGKELQICSGFVLEKSPRNKKIKVFQKSIKKEKIYSSCKDLTRFFERDFGREISHRTLYRILHGEKSKNWNDFEIIELQ